MSAEPATVEIETTDAAPAADIAVDTTGAVGSDVPAANDPSSEAYRSKNAVNDPSFDEAPKPLADNTREEDIYNDGGKGAQTGDQVAQKQIKEQAVPGEWNIGGDGGGQMGKEKPSDKQEKKSEEFWDRIQSLMEESEERKRQDEHARKWDNETHDIAGTRMSGRDFMQMSDYLKSEQGRKKVQEALQQQGMTKDQAEKATKKADEYNDLMKRIRRGDELSPEEEKRRLELQNDQDVKTTVTTTTNLAQQNGLVLKSDKEVEEARIKGADLSLKSNVSPQVHEDTRILEARANFPSAANLSGEFIEAKNAKTPLDNPAFAKDLAKPEVVAAIAKREVSSSGMEL